MSVQVTVLGTASGLPAPDRFGQTVVVSVTDSASSKHYILDTGDGASSLLMRHGIDHNDIEAIFISHMHADHHGGLAQVIKTCGHVGRLRPLTIVAPGEGMAPLRAYLEASYLIPPFLRYDLNWISLAGAVGREIDLPGGATLAVHKNDHMLGYRRRLANDTRGFSYTFESYSAAIKIKSSRVVYSGNLRRDSLDVEFDSFVEPCDIYIGELAHIDPTALGDFLAGRSIRHTVVTHFHPKWNGVPDATILELIKARTAEGAISGKLTLARMVPQ